ncbi:MAG: hypothetical protein H6679_01925 [Epsilonproteobacteria bacterium]|nr:hypothetical protein [Campylobacterota bacterium]
MKKIMTVFFVVFMWVTGNAKANITVAHQPQLVDYVVNADLSFSPCHKKTYDLYVGQIDRLEKLVDKKTGVLELSGNGQAANVGPALTALLQTKVKTLASRLGLNGDQVKIFLAKTSTKPAGSYNAGAQTMVQKMVTERVTFDGKTGKEVAREVVDRQTSYIPMLVLNAETLRLLCWHEATPNYAQCEGLLDGVLAHELGHVYHRHRCSSPEVELEADAAALKALKNPNNLIRCIDLLYCSGNLFSALSKNHKVLGIGQDKLHELITVVASSIGQTERSFGKLGLESSHAKFSYQVSHAVDCAARRCKQRHLASDFKKVASLVFDELSFCADQPFSFEQTEMDEYFKSYDQALAYHQQLSHPDPLTRRVYFEQCANR